MSITPIRSATVFGSGPLHFSATTKKDSRVLDIFLSIDRIPRSEDEDWHIEVKLWDGKHETKATLDLGPNDGAKVGDYGDLLIPSNGHKIPLPLGFPAIKDNPILTFVSFPGTQGGQLIVKSDYFKLVPEKTIVSSPLTPPVTP